MLTSASNLTPQVGRFFAKGKGAKKRPTRSAVYAGVMFQNRVRFMLRVLFVTLMLFVVTVAIILASYLNSLVSVGLSIEWTFDSVPVILNAVIMSLACPLYILFSFFVSKGNYSSFKNSLIGFIIFTPMVLVLIIFPSALELPEHITCSFNFLLFASVAVHYLAVRFCSDHFWVAGGRVIET